jgi:hypothetical protein
MPERFVMAVMADQLAMTKTRVKDICNFLPYEKLQLLHGFEQRGRKEEGV